MTSVKDFRVDEPPSADRLGRGAFVFSDDYSVFDWGKMPDEIPHKGASLCVMGAANFERLGTVGIRTHYRGVVTDASVTSLEDAGSAPTEMAIDLTQVPTLPFRDGSYDYDAYHQSAGENYLVPLEIVFRNTVPVGSSLRERAEPADHDLPLEEWPDDAVALDTPIVEFSTKYEEQDRYLSRAEADTIAGAAAIDELEALARQVNELVTERAAAAGLEHQDGKIECLYYRGSIRVADVMGTFDENRFAYDGQQVSKEVLRQYYKREHPDWVAAVGAAKAEATARNVADWRSLCDADPPSLPESVIAAASDLYAGGANAYTGREWFDAPPLEEGVERVRGL